MIEKINLGISLSVKKGFSIIDILRIIPPTKPVGDALATYNGYAIKYGLPVIPPFLEIALMLAIEGGWTIATGGFLNIQAGLSITRHLCLNLVAITFGAEFAASWLQNRDVPWQFGVTIFSGLDVVLSLRRILGDHWYVPNLTVWEYHLLISQEVPW